MLKIKIAYIGGGSRNWARVFMNDLTLDGELCGEIALYDIDADAALRNKKIGERLCALPEARSQWTYTVSENLDSALKGADFVVISILPGTFEDMRSDVHAPEKYGVYQSVGDTAGPGGVLRAMRTVPVFEYFADAVRRNCPDAWVINFTNPMSVCVKALYGAFPGIKAFGCCHEVFNAQKYLCAVYSDMTGKARPDRRELVTEVAGVNHFTFITKAHIGREDLLAMLPAFMEKYPDGYYIDNSAHSKEGKPFADRGLVKLDLFRRYGALGAAGDRHLVEFCNSAWYLKNPEYVGAYGVKLTPVDYRIEKGERQTAEQIDMANGGPVTLTRSGEEAVDLMKAISGLKTIVSNVNLPNAGQAAFMPIDGIVETNCVFTKGSARPMNASVSSPALAGLLQRACQNIDALWEGIKARDIKAIYAAFVAEPLCANLTLHDSKSLFIEMVNNTRECLEPYYDLSKLDDILNSIPYGI